MANIRISALGADADGHLVAGDNMVVDDGSTTRRIAPPIMTAAQFAAGTDTNPKFVPANVLASAARWLGAFVGNTVKRVGTIFTSSNGTYLVHDELAASVNEAGARAGATRIDRPPDMTDTHVTGGTDVTRSVPTAAQLKSAVDTHRPQNMTNAAADAGAETDPKVPNAAQLKRSVDAFAHIAIRTGTGAASGFKFRSLNQMEYDAFGSDSNDATPDANTVYFITG